MPVDGVTGQCIAFTAAQILAMNIRNFGVRDRSNPTETRRQDENTMTRTFFVNWSSRYDFVELVLGRHKLWTDAGTVKLSRLVPDSNYGRHPTLTQILATRIEYIRGHGTAIEPANKLAEYPTAEIQVYYEHAPFAIRSDAGLSNERQRYVTISDSIRGEAEAYTLPGGAYKLTKAGGGGAHGTPAPINVSFMRPIERFTLWWEWLPYELISDGGALYKRLYYGKNSGGGVPDGIPMVGTVNSEIVEVESAGQEYAAGTLLLEGVERVKFRSPLALSGTDGWYVRCGFNYAFTPRGWLDIFHFDPGTPANSGYYRLSVDGTYYAVNAMPDNYGLFNVRNHNTELFNPNY